MLTNRRFNAVKLILQETTLKVSSIDSSINTKAHYTITSTLCSLQAYLCESLKNRFI